MRVKEFLKVISILEKNLPKDTPSKRLRESYKKTPYTILMATLLSLRTKDEKTAIVTSKLFNKIQTPEELLKIELKELEEIIKPVGFYRKKAKTLQNISKVLIEKFNSKVPSTKEELLSLKGVGEKTANIFLNSNNIYPVIAVDTHVHRITNLLGVVKTKTPNETSKILNKIIPTQNRKNINSILTSFGQTICKPQKAKCEICPIQEYCPKSNKF